MITKQQRIGLRSFAQNLPDIVYIGKGDITDNVIKQINDNLYAHELIKVKVQDTCNLTMEEITAELENRCGCEVVTVIGSKIVIYKESKKPTTKGLQGIREIMGRK